MGEGRKRGMGEVTNGKDIGNMGPDVGSNGGGERCKNGKMGPICCGWRMGRRRPRRQSPEPSGDEYGEYV
eukprot:10078144-Prorocentrum_lima.AAC.1